MDEEETAGKAGCLSETQRKPEGEGAQALFFNCNCGENHQQCFMSEFLIFNHRPLSEIQYYINTVPLQKPKSKNPAAIQKTRVEKQKYVQFPIVCIRGSDFVKCDSPVLCERQRSVTAL